MHTESSLLVQPDKGRYIKTGIMATESTEGHGNILCEAFMFQCSSVDSVAIK